MARHKYRYNWSDAWLLLAIVYAGRGKATLEKIIAVGDGIEHAIFNADELESGLARLTAGGFIREKNGVFSATTKVMKSYAKTTTPRRAIHKELEDMEKLLGAAPFASAQPSDNSLKYDGFSQVRFDEAIKAYLTKFAKK